MRVRLPVLVPMLVLAPLALLVGCTASDPERPPVVKEPRLSDVPAARGDALLRRAMIAGHNAARAAVGAPPLTWNDELAADAARYAATLAATRDFKHSTGVRGRTPEGENLFMGSRGAYRYDEMVRLWVDEGRMYRPGVFPDISTTGRWQEVGHYTQIVWRRTREVGCGLASSRSDDYLVCRYTPPGNVVGSRVEG
ncbi:CAP domain-containing protein [Sphingomonas sp. RB3P16]|uniref:CAP domain-containing protein n=1 Tax=Parasphingomonas frigoris TaxID=3096163 RepID=UPI002FC6AAED